MTIAICALCVYSQRLVIPRRRYVKARKRKRERKRCALIVERARTRRLIRTRGLGGAKERGSRVVPDKNHSVAEMRSADEETPVDVIVQSRSGMLMAASRCESGGDDAMVRLGMRCWSALRWTLRDVEGRKLS